MASERSVHFLDGGGEMADAIRAFDWSRHELGPPDTWPATLKTVVSMALNSRFPKCVVWGPNLISIHNDAFRSILGDKRPALGRSFWDVWAEVWPEIGPIAERAYAGEATFIRDFPLEIDRYGYLEEVHFTFCYSPIRDDRGKVCGMIDTVIETTSVVEAQRQARLLNRELEHRIKNTLSVIAAIVNQTLRSSRSDAIAREVLMRRIGALAQAQMLLTRSTFAEAPVRSVIEEALTPFRTGHGRFEIAGPPVMLSSRQALSLALSINELATNALKYGALTNDAGRVRLTWTAGHPKTDEVFRLAWTEEGGPRVPKTRQKGFGTRIIENVLAEDFMGNVTLTHDPGGFRCELTTQMRHIGEDREVSD